VSLGKSAEQDVIEAGDAAVKALGRRTILRAGSMAVGRGFAGPGDGGLRVHLPALRVRNCIGETPSVTEKLEISMRREEGGVVLRERRQEVQEAEVSSEAGRGE
jgi:hypothetical protein